MMADRREDIWVLDEVQIGCPGSTLLDLFS